MSPEESHKNSFVKTAAILLVLDPYVRSQFQNQGRGNYSEVGGGGGALLGRMISRKFPPPKKKISQHRMAESNVGNAFPADWLANADAGKFKQIYS